MIARRRPESSISSDEDKKTVAVSTPEYSGAATRIGHYALGDIFSLYPTVTHSTTGSGATPIGSAGRAPDRNKI